MPDNHDSLQAASASLAAAGLAVIRGFLAEDQVTALRATADALAESARAADEAAGGGTDLGPHWAATHRGCIFETTGEGGAPGPGPATTLACARTDPALGRLLAGLGAAAVGGGGGGGDAAPLPSSILLLNEQFVVKPPACPSSGFAWHTDGQYMVGGGGGEGGAGGEGREASEGGEACPAAGPPEAATPATAGSLPAAATAAATPLPYISVWVPLDAVGPANGTLEVEWEAARRAGLVPGDAPPPTTTTTAPTRPPAAGPGPTVAVVAAPGDAVVMLSTTPHGSGPNLGGAARRVWMPQLCVGRGGGLAGV